MAPRLRGAHPHDEAEATRRALEVRRRDRTALREVAAIRSEDSRGVAFALCGALAYGITIILGRSLATDGLSGATVLSVRFGVAGFIALALVALARRPILPAPGERIGVVLLGAIGYATESSFFFLGLQHGSAAAVTLLFYLYPTMVALLEVALGRMRFDRRSAGALVLSVSGTSLLVLAEGGVDIETIGIVFSIASAATFSVYLIVSDRVVRVSDAMTAGAWMALGTAIGQLTRGAVTGSLDVPSSGWPALLANGAATAAAFVLLFAALRRLGPSRTAIVFTMEAVWAVALAAVFLGEGLVPVQVAGGAAVLAAVVLVSTRKPLRQHGPLADEPAMPA